MSDATDGEEGCASRVVTLCCTFVKGNDCVAKDEMGCGGGLKAKKYLTVSFSMIALTPWVGVPSNVSMDDSR
jgi:hypothetical protein